MGFRGIQEVVVMFDVQTSEAENFEVSPMEFCAALSRQFPEYRWNMQRIAQQVSFQILLSLLTLT